MPDTTISATELETANRADQPPALHWTAADLAGLAGGAQGVIPAFARDPAARVPGHDLWDMWPVERADGSLPRFAGASLWMVLTAPAGPDPDDRHGIARIHLLSERDGQWSLHQPVFPDGFTPGNREWSGSAVLDDTGAVLTVYFTAAGRRGNAAVTLEQRLFEARCRFAHDAAGFHLSDWCAPEESIVADGTRYSIANQSEGRAGEILGFRDPAWFRDPATGRAFLFFTGSCARATARWTALIGVAEADLGEAGARRAGEGGAVWQLRDPVVSAVGFNNELERPHMRVHGGRYYLFWSTQQKVFAPGDVVGPTGLYGAVGDTPLGPFTLLNGTGLVARTPAAAPAQEYSWWVLDDLRVIGFADFPGIADPAAIADVARRRATFAGYPAPFFRIALDGARAEVTG